jgi:VIT1/CCC1 family predicted Fe2+/Mn2+ transporter
MAIHIRHSEIHRSTRVGWLRAMVLGANDGIVSTASLLVGVASASSGRAEILLSGVAGLVAGAMSMAAGEFVSVSSQSDTEKADLAKEIKELAEDPEHERDELAHIYIGRGLDKVLAYQVADQLTAHDALGSHARDELGITDMTSANPTQAALASAGSFAVGASLPLLVCYFIPAEFLIWGVSLASLVCLVMLGALSARIGGANIYKAALRVGFWGALAMLATALVGKLFGTVVS